MLEGEFGQARRVDSDPEHPTSVMWLGKVSSEKNPLGGATAPVLGNIANLGINCS